ncbi:MAG: lipoate--protein ligase [Clostridiales bacterium]|nr:lipoate--protein ligase [Clostridiales bacterium]
MIKKASFLQVGGTNPYENLAMEEYLMMNCGQDEGILYLWQNRRTVVVGRNQNCWKECDVKQLEKDGGFLVRRLSGGGAVYHDLGNLNFTFLVRKDNYDIDKQTEVIKKAVGLLGIHAERTGRNDITVEGMKFSGNAFYKRGDYCYHHGTILLKADKVKMSKYLTVSAEKLRSKGVNSVPSRVTNLCEFCEGLTVESMSQNLRKAFGGVYGLPVEELKIPKAAEKPLQENRRRFESWEWKYGKSSPFHNEFEKRFSWGNIQLQFSVKEGIIESANVYSDAMDIQWVMYLSDRLPGCRYDCEEICALVKDFPHEVKGDLIVFIKENI